MTTNRTTLSAVDQSLHFSFSRRVIDLSERLGRRVSLREVTEHLLRRFVDQELDQIVAEWPAEDGGGTEAGTSAPRVGAHVAPSPSAFSVGRPGADD